MSVLTEAAIKIGNALPKRWKRSLKWQLMIPDAGASLELLRRRGFYPRYALDIGGYVGNWTLMCKDIWPDASICMFEPQPDKKSRLESICRSCRGVTLRTELLGEVGGQEVSFHLAESGSSALDLLSKPNAPTIVLRTQTLAEAVRDTPFSAPDLIKVDVQGAELQVLNGGQDVLAHAKVVMLEVSLIQEYVGGPLFAEVISYMAQHGLMVHDICTLFRNTQDQTMNEADIIFAREGAIPAALRPT